MLRRYRSTLPESYSPLHEKVFDMVLLNFCQHLSKIIKQIFNGFAAQGVQVVNNNKCIYAKIVTSEFISK